MIEFVNTNSVTEMRFGTIYALAVYRTFTKALRQTAFANRVRVKIDVEYPYVDETTVVDRSKSRFLLVVTPNQGKSIEPHEGEILADFVSHAIEAVRLGFNDEYAPGFQVSRMDIVSLLVEGAQDGN